MSGFVAVLMRGTILPTTSPGERECVLIYGVEHRDKPPSATHLQSCIDLRIGCIRRMTSSAIENPLLWELSYLLRFLDAPMNINIEHSASAPPLRGDIDLSRFPASHFLFG